MRGQRARAAVLDRLAAIPGVLPSDARAVLDEIGDDPADWPAIATDLFEMGRNKPSQHALNAVAALMRFALEVISRHHPLRDRYVDCYRTALVQLAERFGDLGVLAEAEAALLPEAERRAETGPLQGLIRYDVGRIAVALAQHSPGADTTKGVIRARLRLLPATPPGHPDRPEMMSRLGVAYHDLYHQNDDRNAVTDAVRWTREALDQAPDNHSFLGAILHSAATVLKHQYEFTNDVDLLRETIRLFRGAASRLPDTDLRSETAQLLYVLYERTDDPARLDESIGMYRDVIKDATGTAAAVANARLGLALQARYQRIGNPDDLAEAIHTMRHAAETVPSDHPGYSTIASNFAGVLAFANNRERDESIRDEAVRILRTAARTGDPKALNNLGTHLSGRSVDTGDRRDLREAIDTLERAIAATPPGDPDLASRLGNLGEALYYSFQRTGDPAELDRTIDLARQAIAAATQADLAGYLSTLGIRLHARYQRTTDLAELTEAATTARRAVAALPAFHPYRSVIVSDAIRVLRALYVATKQPAALEEAIELGRSELAALPAGHGGRGGLLMAFASALQHSCFDFGDDAAGQEARSLFLEASRIPGVLTNQVLAARLAGLLSVREQDWANAADAMADAVNLLPRLAARQLVRTDQELQLDTATGLVHDACACALNAGDTERALALLEHGRGILFAQALENRDELTELRKYHPDLATQVEQIRESLAAWSIDGATSADEHRALALRWDGLTADIRALPGFEHFLLPPPAGELRTAAVDGPVVLFSISDFRSDALILTRDGIEVVRLPGATPEEIRRRAQEFLTDGNTVPETLEWLWNEITGPVLDRLELSGQSGDSWPRVWWCPTGPLSFLPLHAAGHHRSPRGEAPRTVMDRVVSSYTPTVRALLHARRHRAFDDQPRALVVAMPATAGATDLPGVTHEAEFLAAHLPNEPTVLGAADALRDRVLAELPGHGWVHFACHGCTDLSDPSASYLLLGDHATKPLTILDISRLHLDNADLACLSACSTAQVGTTLTDEAIHLAAAFHLAGYRHVIATLWPVNDLLAARFSRKVYATIMAQGSDAAAHAVHRATREARDRYPEHPHVWAAHIHTGA